MNKILLILCFACLPFVTFAQPINSWPTVDTWWELQLYDDVGNPYGLYQYWHLDGDTVLQNKSYQKVFRYNTGSQTDTYYAATREDSLNRVYIFFSDSIGEVLLYDFGAMPGDTIQDVTTFISAISYGREDLVVNWRDTVMLADGPHIRLVVEHNGFATEWFDGVGAMNDPIHPRYMPLLSGDYQLECFNRESVPVVIGDCKLLGGVYSPGPEINIGPNPTSGIIALSGFEAGLGLRAQLYDLQGSLKMEWKVLPETIDLGDLPESLYILTIEGEGIRRTFKIFKK